VLSAVALGTVNAARGRRSPEPTRPAVEVALVPVVVMASAITPLVIALGTDGGAVKSLPIAQLALKAR